MLIVAFYPGLMATDSLFQYVQAKSGQISNWHPPIMAYLWQQTDRMIEGPGGMYLLAMTVYCISVITLSFQLFLSFWGRMALFMALLFPTPLSVLITVWKDSLMLASLMAALSLLVWIRKEYHPLTLLAGLGFLTLAALLRHNAILALLPLIWLFLAAHPKSCSGFCRAAYVVIIAGLMLQSGKLIDSTTYQVSPIPMVAVWDLAALSIATEQMLIPDYARHTDTDLDTVKRLFSPTNNVSLCRLEDGVRKLYCVEVLPLHNGDGLAADRVPDLIQTWLLAIVAYPEAYLQHRFNLMLHLFDIDSEEDALGFNTGTMQPAALEGEWYDGPTAQTLGIASFAEPTIIGKGYIYLLSELRLHTPLLSPWLYAMLFLAALLFYVKRHGKRPARVRQSMTVSSEIASSSHQDSPRNDGLAGGLLLSGFLMAAPLFVIAPNYQLRYLIWPIVVAVISTILVIPAKAGISVTSQSNRE